MVKIAIVGSRDYPHLYRILQYMKKLPIGTTIISGGGGDVDNTAEKAADKLGFAKKIFKPDYKSNSDKVAPLKRNTKIAEECDGVVAFWDGESNGTLDTIRKAVKLNKKVIIYGIAPIKKEEITIALLLQNYAKWSCKTKSNFSTYETIEVLANKMNTSVALLEHTENGFVNLYFRATIQTPDLILVPPQCEICNERKAYSVFHKREKILQACEECMEENK